MSYKTTLKAAEGRVSDASGRTIDNHIFLSLQGEHLDKLRRHGYSVVKRYRLKGVSSNRVAVIGLLDLLQ